MLTLTDLFCGAGGSSTGATHVPGVAVKYAINHWERAIETHNTNHPNTSHDCADISTISPRKYHRTDILWGSPECTNHSKAKGKKKPTNQPTIFGELLPDEAAEKSRATMYDIPRFAEIHNYEVILLENVVEAYDWPPFQGWLISMDSLGYDHELIFMNSMHASAQGKGAPQSRDRMYICFWKKGNRKPDLETLRRPKAFCAPCGEVVDSRQWWKNPNRQSGKYGQQYLYRCPNDACRRSIVEPYWEPAGSIIDWTDLGERIGDRKFKDFYNRRSKEFLGNHPLAPKTMARIEMAMNRHWGPQIIEHGGNGYDAADPKHPQHMNPDSYYRAWPTSDPVRTLHTRESKGIATHPDMATPSLTMAYYGSGMNTNTVNDPLSTLTTVERHALLTKGKTFDIMDVNFRMLKIMESQKVMAFPDEYIITGNKSEQHKQIGNAVCPPNARDLVAAAVDSLT